MHKFTTCLLFPCPHRAEGLCIDGHRLSVRLSVCPVPDHKSRTEGHSKLKFGRQEAHNTGDQWLHLEVKRSKVKVTRPLSPVTENQPYLRNRSAYELHFKLVIRTMTRITDMRSDLKGQGHQTALGGTTRRGRRRIVAAPLQAAQLV